jgi:hypothetical protein
MQVILPCGQRCALPTTAHHRNRDPNCRRLGTQLTIAAIRTGRGAAVMATGTHALAVEACLKPGRIRLKVAAEPGLSLDFSQPSESGLLGPADDRGWSGVRGARGGGRVKPDSKRAPAARGARRSAMCGALRRRRRAAVEISQVVLGLIGAGRGHGDFDPAHAFAIGRRNGVGAPFRNPAANGRRSSRA